jgi:hypothetical protein
MGSTDFLSANVTSQWTVSAQETDDSATCQWLQNNPYAGKYGW